MTEILSADELMHFGIKGMHWGVRRYQNEDGTLTDLGKKKQNVKDAKRLSLFSTKRKQEIEYAKRELRDAKLSQKIPPENEKSKHRLNLEAKYQAKGFTKKEAELRAQSRIQTEKVLAVAGGITLASVAAYAGYSHYQSVTDRVLKTGSKMGRVTINENEPMDRAFYAFHKKQDAHKYLGMYGKSLYDHKSRSEKVYQKAMSLRSNLKIASPKSAQKGLNDWYKTLPDSDKQTVLDQIQRGANTWGMSGQMFDKKGNFTKKAYHAFNVALVDKDSSVPKEYYNFMKQRGYDAVQDVNDRFYSGFGSKDPLIIFNGDKVATDKISEIGYDFIKSHERKALSRITTEMMIKYGGGFTAGTAAQIMYVIGMDKLQKTYRNDIFVKEYREEHPKSKLSYNEILKMKK